MVRFVPSVTPRRLVIGWLVVVLVAAIGYLAITAFMARRDLTDAKAELSAVKTQLLAGDRIGAQSALAAADKNASAAHARTGGPIWAVAAGIPWLGEPLHTVRDIAADADRLTSTTLPQLVQVARTLSPQQLRTAPDRVDIGALSSAAPTLGRADTQTEAVLTDADALSHHTWLSAADNARSEFASLVAQLHDTVHTASTAADLLPTMLGGDGTRRYLLVIQTNAEARGLGGLPGVFAVIQARDGKISFQRFGNDSDVTGKAHVNLGPDFNNWYVQFHATQIFVNTTLTPQFPSVAQLWMSMWQDTFHQRLDGAIATDPVAMSYLLGATGPVSLHDGTQVTADNVVQLIESTAYSRFSDTTQRKAFFVDVGRTVADHALHSDAGGRGLIDALGKAVGERRLLIWSAHSDEEQQLEAQPVGGTIPETSAPFDGVVVNNAAGSKLDYYLDRHVTYALGSCTGNTRSSTVTAVLHNAAPTHGLPPYVTIRSDDPQQRVRPGTERLLVTFYATDGAKLAGMSVDGKRTNQVFRAREAGHPMFTVTVEIPPQASTTVQLKLTEPVSSKPVVTLRQPLVRPLTEDITRTSC